MNGKPEAPAPGGPQPGLEEALFEAARALPAENRDTYLDRACAGDAPLRRRLNLLLKANEAAGAFLEPPSSPAAGPTHTLVIAEPPTEKPGDVIGRYKIREKLGEGGCGVVYVAEQSEPVRRRVALKVIKLGMDTRSVIARFEAERQALAMMDHPNIARVLDAGATETGRPYFVMELVRGIRITDYCDQHQLDTAQRLRLFVQVCHAVQHAHQKGIIHRDIKPSNILVTLHDGVPVPKVIDFGIAKATEGRLTAMTVYTELYQFIGTPAYMSPEQAEMSGLDIDTRSDIYSLGVLLYELLTGKTPFDPEELIKAGLDQLRKTIRELEPPRPSTRLSTMMAADLTAVAKRHSAEAPKLVHSMQGDLDWIVMKALEKDRTRRFETASGLALDVERYLSNEPVLARPPSSLYRFQKMVGRNRVAFTAAGGIAAALVLGFGLSLYLFVQERHALRRAVAAERQQATLRAQAEAGLALERKVNEMAPISQKLSRAGLFMSQGEFDKADEVMSQVPPIPQSALIYTILGNVHARSGQLQAAISNYTKCVEVDPTNHLAYRSLAPLLAYTGSLDAYRQHRVRTLRQFGSTTDPIIAERMAKDCLIVPPQPAELEPINKMVDTALAAGPTNTLWEYFEFAKGFAEYRQGHFAQAADWVEKVVPHENDPNRTVQAYMVLAMAQHQLKQPERAATTLAKGLQLAADKVARVNGTEWFDQMTAQVLMREATALIQPPANSSDASK